MYICIQLIPFAKHYIFVYLQVTMYRFIPYLYWIYSILFVCVKPRLTLGYFCLFFKYVQKTKKISVNILTHTKTELLSQ